MRIFFPALLDFSNTKTDLSLLAAVIAHIKPAAPAPRITTSNCSFIACIIRTISYQLRLMFLTNLCVGLPSMQRLHASLPSQKTESIQPNPQGQAHWDQSLFANSRFCFSASAQSFGKTRATTIKLMIEGMNNTEVTVMA